MKDRRKSLVILERKVLRKIYSLCKDVNTREWSDRKNRKLKELDQYPSIMEDITVR